MSFSTPRPGCPPCDSTLAPFLHADGLPFADVLTAADIAQAFADEQVSFGQTAQAFWTPALTLWTFLSQVLSGIKSCRPAVARAFVTMALTRAPADLDTGNYCRARAKLPLAVLQRLTLQVGHALEKAAPASWLWHGQHAVLVDGFTVTLADTPENQKAYPQPNTQKPGLGSPLLRAVVLLSLATAAVQGLAVGPYQGKESGETALLRTLLDQLAAGTIVVADRFFCSYFMVALLRAQGVQVVMRLHQRRSCDFRRGRRLGPDDHVVTWHKPQRPVWMDEATYATLAATLAVREIRKRVTEPGCRVQELVVVTTLLDEAEYSSDDIADLYHQRWHVELDIRVIKTTLKMDELRCLTPLMVAKEIWVHFLGYNLIRKVAAGAALLRGVCPRTISFAASQQVVLGSWSKLTEATAAEQLLLGRELLRVLGKEEVGDRPGRCEPRALKRRPKKQKLLMKPRAEARAELLAGRGKEGRG
jgi:putative transposase